MNSSEAQEFLYVAIQSECPNAEPGLALQHGLRRKSYVSLRKQHSSLTECISLGASSV